MPDLPAEVRGGAHALGPQLEPALKASCDGKLHDIRWFRTDWQRSGAATGYALADIAGEERKVVIKAPVGPRELMVTRDLAETTAPTPGVAFCDESMGGWDLAWVVMEHLPGDPLAAHLRAEVFQELAEAAVRFYTVAAETWSEPKLRPEPDWPGLIERSLIAVRDQQLDHVDRWQPLIDRAAQHWDALTGAWISRPIDCWCHGDLHPGNLMRRAEGSPWGPAGPVLLDFAEARTGHWTEDAIILERLFWARPDLLESARPVGALIDARRSAGIEHTDEDEFYLQLRRLLVGATAPALLARDGHPAYIEAALGYLERTMPVVLPQL